jgi:hypothetical protein
MSFYFNDSLNKATKNGIGNFKNYLMEGKFKEKLAKAEAAEEAEFQKLQAAVNAHRQGAIAREEAKTAAEEKRKRQESAIRGVGVRSRSQADQALAREREAKAELYRARLAQITPTAASQDPVNKDETAALGAAEATAAGSAVKGIMKGLAEKLPTSDQMDKGLSLASTVPSISARSPITVNAPTYGKGESEYKLQDDSTPAPIVNREENRKRVGKVAPGNLFSKKEMEPLVVKAAKEEPVKTKVASSSNKDTSLPLFKGIAADRGIVSSYTPAKPTPKKTKEKAEKAKPRAKAKTPSVKPSAPASAPAPVTQQQSIPSASPAPAVAKATKSNKPFPTMSAGPVSKRKKGQWRDGSLHYNPNDPPPGVVESMNVYSNSLTKLFG